MDVMCVERTRIYKLKGELGGSINTREELLKERSIVGVCRCEHT